MPTASTIETSGNYQTWPKFLACVDYDDVNPISGAQDPYNAMKNRSDAMYGNFGIPRKKVKFQFRPRVPCPAYKTAATWGYSSKPSPWLRTYDTSVPHYGVKIACEQWGSSVNFWGTGVMHLDVMFTYVIDLRFPKVFTDT